MNKNKSNLPASFALGIFGKSGGGKNRFITAMLTRQLTPSAMKSLDNVYNVLGKRPNVFIYAQFTSSYDVWQEKNFEQIAANYPTQIFTYEEASRSKNETDANDWLMLLKHFYHHAICGRLFSSDESCTSQFEKDLGNASRKVRKREEKNVKNKQKRRRVEYSDDDNESDDSDDEDDVNNALQQEYIENQFKPAQSRKPYLAKWQDCNCYCAELCRNKPKSSIVSKIAQRLLEQQTPTLLILDDALTFGLNASNFNAFISKFMFNQRRHLGISLIFIAQTFIKTVRNSPRLFESFDVKIITPAQYHAVVELLRRDNYSISSIKDIKDALETHYFVVPYTGLENWFVTKLK